MGPRRVGVLLAGAIVLGACGKGEPGRSDVSEAPGATVPLSDGAVVMLVTQVSTGEISAAGAARGKLQDPGVRAYAERMLAEPGAMNDHMRGLPVKGDAVSRPPAQFATQQAVSADEGALISTMPAGPAFDRTFIALQINGHAAALDSLRKWQQMAHTPAVRDGIGAAIPMIQTHLAEARSLQARMGGSVTPGPMLPPPPDTAWYKGGGGEPARTDTGRHAVVPARTAGGGTTPPSGPASAPITSAPVTTVRRRPPQTDTAGSAPKHP